MESVTESLTVKTLEEQPPSAESKPVEEEEEKVEDSVVNGTRPEEDDNNEELTPPPDTPIDDTPADDTPADEHMSRASSPKFREPGFNVLEDEIVVGTHTNAVHNDQKSSPLRVTSDQEDAEMDEAAEETPAVSTYPKRKRTSVYTDLSEEKESPSAVREEPEVRPRITRPATKTHGMGGVKGVILGYWRDSEPEDPRDKHAVIGFIDVRDRLRTRIQPTTRDGRSIVHEYPLPPGPGGSWVTFEKVAFDDRLVNLDHNQVKEFVKIRAENVRKDETPEEKDMLDEVAIREAIHRVATNPPPESAVPVAIAYGPVIPEHAQMHNRPESKKRRLLGTFNSNTPGGASAGSPGPTQAQSLDNIPGTRPTRILLGYWKMSSESEPLDKHAVYGILGANDMFRVKLVRETRGGRPLLGNFPVGAGALWIHWDEVEFEPHLKLLSRPEIKEYCRVRQRQIDEGELESERIANETKAVYEAQHRVANSFTTSNTYSKKEESVGSPAMLAPALGAMTPNGHGYANGHGYDDSPEVVMVSSVPIRQSNRQNGSNLGLARGRHSLPDVELRAANRPSSQSVDALERTNTIARKEIARVEAMQQRQDQRAAQRAAEQAHAQAQQQAAIAAASGIMASVGPPGQHIQTTSGGNVGGSSNKTQFQDNIQRLTKVWAAQEANRLKASGGTEDAKVYMGVKYERKQNGPFQGKLVSQGTIISIDGEDYVEYRVLTKPTFF
ncbi:hypothetical protein QBC46DRAFT_348955 [Diplogelasinospora grovesii]|uniref:Uncharacterized protein n=1 Tax=Diplogelasinospora grovesii TaxID=303347 RepID=A0AAN6NID4_9PEZI|nr:hypothetical protein QBC46DRAFT_348955 [Diplogelasinospora grovesii]